MTESSSVQSITNQQCPKRSSRSAGFLKLLVALTSALLLAACGADVNTQLELDKGYSGERQFVLTMAESDADTLSGGLDAAEQSFQSHLPDALTFEGIEPVEDGYKATFIMQFDDVDDYRNKITSLLDASDIAESERGMNVQVDEQQLVTSVEFEEDFYNDELMRWASDALVEDEVVPGNTPVLTSNGTASVIFDGEEVDNATSLPRINFSLTDDRRFEEIDLDFEILDSGEFNVAMDYLVSSDATAIQNEFVTERVEQLEGLDGVTGAVEDSGPVENHESGNPEPREVSVRFSSAESVQNGMRILLANEEATFATTEVTPEDSPDVVTEYVGSNWSCDAICDPENVRQLSGATDYPDQWQVVDQQRSNGELYIKLNRGMPLDSLTSTTQLDIDGTMVQTFEFAVDNETQSGHEDTVAELFQPPEGSGTYDMERTADTTLYSTTFKADDAQELTNKINDYLEAKGISDTSTIEHESLTGLWSEYDLNVDLSPVWSLASGGVEGTAVFQVDLPAMHKGKSEGTSSSNGTIVLQSSSGDFNVSASGPTIVTIWALAAVIMVLVLGLIVLIIWHKRRAVRSTAESTNDDHSTKPYYVQGPGDDLTETEIFRSPLAPSALSEQTLQTPSPNTLETPQNVRSDEQHETFPDTELPLEPGSSAWSSAQENVGTEIYESFDTQNHDQDQVEEPTTQPDRGVSGPSENEVDEE